MDGQMVGCDNSLIKIGFSACLSALMNGEINTFLLVIWLVLFSRSPLSIFFSLIFSQSDVPLIVGPEGAKKKKLCALLAGEPGSCLWWRLGGTPCEAERGGGREK
jgi:hypothetical protein